MRAIARRCVPSRFETMSWPSVAPGSVRQYARRPDRDSSGTVRVAVGRGDALARSRPPTTSESRTLAPRTATVATTTSSDATAYGTNARAWRIDP